MVNIHCTVTVALVYRLIVADSCVAETIAYSAMRLFQRFVLGKKNLAIKSATVTSSSISLGIMLSFSYLNKQNAGK